MPLVRVSNGGSPSFTPVYYNFSAQSITVPAGSTRLLAIASRNGTFSIRNVTNATYTQQEKYRDQTLSIILTIDVTDSAQPVQISASSAYTVFNVLDIS